MQSEMKARVQRVRELAGMRGFTGLLVVGRAPDRNGDLLYLCDHVPMLAGHPSRFAVRGRGLGILYIPTDSKLGLQLAVSTPFYVPGVGVEKTVANPNIVAAAAEILKGAGVSGETIGLVGMDVISAMNFAELLQYNPTIRFVEADDLVMNLRAVKSERELAALRTGSRMADEVGELLRERIVAGVTEQSL
jgi:Xaa-Pro aminopeptidase